MTSLLSLGSMRPLHLLCLGIPSCFILLVRHTCQLHSLSAGMPFSHALGYTHPLHLVGLATLAVPKSETQTFGKFYTTDPHIDSNLFSITKLPGDSKGLGSSFFTHEQTKTESLFFLSILNIIREELL